MNISSMNIVFILFVELLEEDKISYLEHVVLLWVKKKTSYRKYYRRRHMREKLSCKKRRNDSDIR